MARPRKSTEAKKAAGTLRPCREKQRVQPETFATLTQLPPAPAELKKAGKEIWHKLGAMLIGKGICNIDLYSFQEYCAQYDIKNELYNELTNNGKQSLARGIENTPAVYRAYKFHIDTIRRYAVEFGLTPRSRTNLDAPPQIYSPEQEEEKRKMRELIGLA